MNEKIITIPVGPLGVNCYIVYKTDSDKALVIDPGGDFSLIQSVLKENKLTAGAVLITHCHFDHIMATSEFNKLKVPVYMSENDVSFINSNGNLAVRQRKKLRICDLNTRFIFSLQATIRSTNVAKQSESFPCPTSSRFSKRNTVWHPHNTKTISKSLHVSVLTTID